MAERRNKRDVCLEYTFDRLLVAKLEQVYRTFVPDRVRVVGEPAPAQAGGSKLIGAGDEDGGDLRPGIVGQAEGGEHHRQPNGPHSPPSKATLFPLNGYSKTKAIVARV
jgi:hypothetical protein